MFIYSTQIVTGEDIIEMIKQANIPIVDVYSYDEKTDPNGLLGRPGQYIEKLMWQDARVLEKVCEATVEIFINKKDLEIRKNYLKRVWDFMPITRQYIYEYKNALIRVDFELLPSDAKSYEILFTTVPAET